MGLFKKIKKAIKKVTKAPLKLAGLAQDAPSAPGAPDVAPAPVIEPPKEDVVKEDSVETESDKKRTKASGKKSLSVARSSGSGVNI